MIQGAVKKYEFSPKVVVVSGPMASGKTELGIRLAEELGYDHFCIDGMHQQIAENEGTISEKLNHPKYEYAYTVEFIKLLRSLRYNNVVVEGTRFILPHVMRAMEHAAYAIYGEYVLFQSFYILPTKETHVRFWNKRLASLKEEFEILEAAGNGDSPRATLCRKFLSMTFPDIPTPPANATVVDSPDVIMDWTSRNTNSEHPSTPKKHRDLYKAIADSGSHTPFYQTVEVDGERVVTGSSESFKTWKNLLNLKVDYAGKSLAEIGCDHGYFCFKAEELGASCHGYEIVSESMECARVIAEARNSSCTFECKDVLEGLDRKFDIIFALNVLHRVKDFTKGTRLVFKNCNQAVLEIGEEQLASVVEIALALKFKMRKIVKSHRSGGILKSRIVVLFERQG